MSKRGIKRYFQDEAEMSGSDHEDDYEEEEENEDDRAFLAQEDLNETDSEDIQAEVKFAIMEAATEVLHEFYHLEDPVSEDIAKSIASLINKSTPSTSDIISYLASGPGNGEPRANGAGAAAIGSMAALGLGGGDPTGGHGLGGGAAASQSGPMPAPITPERGAGGRQCPGAPARRCVPGLIAGGGGRRCKCILCEFVLG